MNLARARRRWAKWRRYQQRAFSLSGGAHAHVVLKAGSDAELEQMDHDWKLPLRRIRRRHFWSNRR